MSDIQEQGKVRTHAFFLQRLPLGAQRLVLTSPLFSFVNFHFSTPHPVHVVAALLNDSSRRCANWSDII